MSASLTATHTCILVKSFASRKRLGALRLATTVWPTLTRRSTITPSTGAMIVQYETFAFASSRLAWTWATAASWMSHSAAARSQAALSAASCACGIAAGLSFSR